MPSHPNSKDSLLASISSLSINGLKTGITTTSIVLKLNQSVYVHNKFPFSNTS
jgi:hypothetical protein